MKRRIHFIPLIGFLLACLGTWAMHTGHDLVALIVVLLIAPVGLYGLMLAAVRQGLREMNRH
ncbi:MAG: hypothetical protein ACRD2O_08445 [Terriglobia bacterium]